MNIEDYIRKNKDSLDIEAIPKGHQERFLDKLNTQNNKRNVILIVKKYATAVIVLLMVTLSTLYINDNWVNNSNEKLPTLSSISPEYATAEAYFVSTIQHQKNTIYQLSVIDKIRENKIIKTELQSMDSLYIKLQQDLKANPNDPRVINSMIKHYKLKIRVLQQIISELQQVNNNTSKNKEYEKVNL